MPSLSFVSDCFRQEASKIEINNQLPDIETRMLSLFETKIIPLIESVVEKYLEKKLNENKKSPVLVNEDN
jgi:hypothetical protein